MKSKNTSNLIYVNARFLSQKLTGVQRFALEVSKELKRTLPNLVFLAPKNIIYKKEAAILDVKVIGNLSGQLWEQVELPLFLFGRKAPLLNLANSAPLLHRRNYITIHDLAFLENPKWFSKKYYQWYKFLIPDIARKAIKVFTVSVFSKNEIISKLAIEEEKIVVVNNAVNFSNIQNAEYLRRNNRILTVGSMDPRKNLGLVLDAFNKLNGDYELIVVGGVFNSFRQFYHNIPSENIKFVGYVTDEELEKYYKTSSLFIYASLYEGFGIPPLEAMHYSLPVMLSSISVHEEIYGDSALYFSPFSDVDLKDKIQDFFKISEASKDEIVRKGLIKVSEYSWTKTATAIKKSIEKNKVLN